jgi:hypothetical protein
VSNAENQPTGHGPKGWLEKGPSASLFVRYVSHRICSSLTPRIQTLLKPTVCLLLMTRCTSGRDHAKQSGRRWKRLYGQVQVHENRCTCGLDLNKHRSMLRRSRRWVRLNTLETFPFRCIPESVRKVADPSNEIRSLHRLKEALVEIMSLEMKRPMTATFECVDVFRRPIGSRR